MPVLPPQRRLELLGRFARSLAHDVRNSLNVMSLHLQLVADRSKSGRAPSIEEMQRAEKSLRDQVGKIDGLVTRFARFASPVREGPEEDLGEVVASAIGLCEMQARRARLGLETDLPSGAWSGAAPDAAGDLVADLLCRLCDLPDLSGTKLRVALHADGRLELEAQAAWPRAFAESARELARRAGVELSLEERRLVLGLGGSSRSG
jgi:signal transduction histidine kinase